MSAYYNEWDKKAAAWLRELIAEGHIPAGDVDERSITDVRPDELAGYDQLHFFAGIGGWALGARLAGWPDDRPIVTGSCPCQPYSVAGKGKGAADARHLWPDFFPIIRARRPIVVMGEQVAAAVGKGWFTGVRTDLEGIGYAVRAVVVPACAVNAPHRRDRLWFAAGLLDVGDADCERLEERERIAGVRRAAPRALTRQDSADSGFMDLGHVEHAESFGRGEGRAESGVRGGRSAIAGASLSHRHVAHPNGGHAGAARLQRGGQHGQFAPHGGAGALGAVADDDQRGRLPRIDGAPARLGHPAPAAGWDGARWLISHDGKARRVEPSIPLLVDGIPNRVGLLRGFGNAIAPQIAAEMMGAWLEEFPENRADSRTQTPKAHAK